MRVTGGRWDPTERNVYFVASGTKSLETVEVVADYLLVAINELNNRKDLDTVEDWIDAGAKVFIDSGIFWLANTHAVKHGILMDDALRLAPEELDAFDWLEERYVRTLEAIGERVWGYIEMDQGGAENKRRTRARHESLGLSPMPVYHPIVDGWEYFDELAGSYDRICFGNVVQANSATRKRLVATAWERRRAYPDLWIHLLGFTPGPLLNAYPIDSADSSSWLSAVRWHAGHRPVVCNVPFGEMPRNFRYKLGTTENYDKAVNMSACGFRFQVHNWRGLLESYRETVGCDERMPTKKKTKRSKR